MKPPATCAELARRLRAAAQPLHGRTYHDLRLAAAIIEDVSSGFHEETSYLLRHLLANDPALYQTEPEGER